VWHSLVDQFRIPGASKGVPAKRIYPTACSETAQKNTNEHIACNFSHFFRRGGYAASLADNVELFANVVALGVAAPAFSNQLLKM
jgi:hypothetical protein